MENTCEYWRKKIRIVYFNIFICVDYKKSLNYFKDNNIKFNIIFVDPPYDYDVLDKVKEMGLSFRD